MRDREGEGKRSYIHILFYFYFKALPTQGDEVSNLSYEQRNIFWEIVVSVYTGRDLVLSFYFFHFHFHFHFHDLFFSVGMSAGLGG